MDIAPRRTWTQEEFLDWVEGQEKSYEFDGLQPVEMFPGAASMNGGSADHNVIALNIHFFLRQRLNRQSFRIYAQSMGIATTGNVVRYPDVFVTTAPYDGKSRIVGDPITLFEVVSPTSVRMDRHIKMREYAAVPSIRRYIVVESEWVGVQVLTREAGTDAWRYDPRDIGEALVMPELGTELTMAEIYEGTSLAHTG